MRKYFRNRSLNLALALLLSPFCHFGQQQQLDSLKTRFQEYREHVVTEKLFIHCDRTSYMTGETLWFKIYVVDGTFHKPIDVSKVGYVELLDREGKAVLQTKVELTHGSGNGSIFIPATLASDYYSVRGYTSAMKNLSADYYFHQAISIINPFRKPETTSRKTAFAIDAQFMPEGGHLVSGVPSRVAFRVTDHTGVGIDFNGAIIDQRNDTLLHFQPERFGIGTFTLTPDANSNYRAVIKVKGKSQHLANLPAVSPTGYTLEATTTAEAFTVDVRTNVQLAQPVIYLFAHARNQIVKAEMKFISQGRASFTIPKSSLPAGVSQVTIFDADLNPVCERLIYTRPTQILNIKSTTDGSEYSLRRKVKLSIGVASQNKPQSADLSVSVFKRDSLTVFNPRRIADYLLLSSDLNGSVDSPAYYLSDGTDHDFDNLMLTHGWRKFDWAKIRTRDFAPKFLPEVQGPMLSGQLLDETGKPAANIKTFLSSPSKNIRLFTYISGPNGEIHYTLKDLKGQRKIILQTNFSRDSLYEFKLQSPFASEGAAVRLPEFVLSSNQQQTLLSRSISMQVQDVYNSDQYFKVSEAPADSTPFYGKPDESYLLDDYTRFPVMEEVMREYVPGVWVRKRQGEFYFMVLDNINKSVFKEDPLIIIDGVPVFKADEIMAFNPLKVKRLDVVDRLFFLGRSTFPGIVSYSTYTGDLAGFKIHPKSVVLDYDGLQLQRSFYTPTYESERQRSNRMPDQRTLLQWSPSVKAVDGKAEVEFYTSDLSGTFEVNVQGISAQGEMGSSTATFTVIGYENP